MKKLIILFAFIVVTVEAFGASTRTIDGDFIRSSDASKTWTMPSATGTMVISGQIPIGGQLIRDGFSGNGSTTIFTLTQTPFNTGHVMVYQNGILLTYTTDYTISGTSLTMVTAPAIGQNLLVIYSRY